MTRVDFYILEGDSGDKLRRLACRLTDKAWHRGLRIYVHAGSADQAAALDDLLWTFRDGSFIPHSTVADAGERHADHAALIGAGEEPPTPLDLLINLADTVPSFFSRFERVAELVDAHADRRLAGRERFRYYRDRGYPIETHQLR